MKTVRKYDYEPVVVPATITMPLAITFSPGFIPYSGLFEVENRLLELNQPNGPHAEGARRVFGNPKPLVLSSLKQRGGFVYVPLCSTTKPRYGKA